MEIFREKYLFASNRLVDLIFFLVRFDFYTTENAQSVLRLERFGFVLSLFQMMTVSSTEVIC